VKVLDRYIIQKYLQMFFFMIGAFIVIAVVMDVSERIDDLIAAEASVWEIITEYYINFIFFYANLLSGLLIFLTVILVTSNLAQKSELVAIISSGVSFQRLLVPFMIAASFLVVLSLLVVHLILPKANEIRLAFEDEHIRHAFNIEQTNLHRELQPGTIYYFRTIRASSNRGHDFSIEHWTDDGLLREKLFASKAVFIPEDTLWSLYDVQVRKYASDGSEEVITQKQIDTTLNLRISDFGQREENVFAMNYFELNDFIEEEKSKGSDKVPQWQIEKYQRTSNAFSILVLTLIGFSIASRKKRGGMGVHLLLAVLIGFLFIFFQRMFNVAAVSIDIPPMLAVWMPNFIFLIFGLILYQRAPK